MEETPNTPTDLEALPAIAREGVLRAVIEIPAGTVDKRQYDPATNSFPVDMRNGKPRRITCIFSVGTPRSISVFLAMSVDVWMKRAAASFSNNHQSPPCS